MSDRKHQQQFHGVDRRRAPRAHTGQARAAAAAPAGDAANLLKRNAKPGGRHGAITNTLYSWHSYKNWADKMRGSWEEKK